jgi:hypothetical protein
MEQARPPVVFLGPSLPRDVAKDKCDAIYLPPAAQGAIICAVERHEPRALLIIDGIFQSEPAVRHKEILWAIAQGVRVIGAASMGALRAAELHRHGMIGIGLIYRWYRRHAFAPDDAVAVLHMPAELGAAAMTLSLVDLVQTVKRAERQGLIDRKERARLAAAARSLNYRERSLANMVEKAAVPVDCAMLDRHIVEQKRLDAIQALRFLAKASKLPASPISDFTWTTAFVRDLRHANMLPPAIESRTPHRP